MKKLQKLVCVWMAVCITFLNAGVLFADTGLASVDASQVSDAGDEVFSNNGSIVQEEPEQRENTGDGTVPPGSQMDDSMDSESNYSEESDTGDNGQNPTAVESGDSLADGRENESVPEESEEYSNNTEIPENNNDEEAEYSPEDSEQTEENVLPETETTEPAAGADSNVENLSEEENGRNFPESEEGYVTSDEDAAADLLPDETVEENGGEESKEEKEPELQVKKAVKLQAAEATSKAAETFTVKFNANGGTGTMASLTGLTADTTDKIPVNAFHNTGTEGGYVKNWNTKKDGTGKSYAPNSGLSSVIGDAIADEKQSVTLYAQWTPSVTVNVRVVETHPSETVFGTQTGSSVYSRYNDGNYIQKSADGGATWTRTIAKVSTEDEYYRLPRVSAQAGMSLTRPGYTNANSAAYNTLKDGTGVFLRANQTSADQSNTVNTTTLNGGVPITEAGHTINIYVYWSPNSYDLKVHNNASSIGKQTEEASVVYRDLQVGTKYYLNNGSYSVNAYPSYNWLTPSPGFYFEGYLFYGWNTKADGSGDWFSGLAPAFSNLSRTGGDTADLYAVWKKQEGITDSSTVLENGAVITRGYNNFSGVDLMIPKYYTGEGKQTDPDNIEFGVSGGGGRIYWNRDYSEPDSGEDDEGDSDEEDSGSGAGSINLAVKLEKGTKKIYSLGNASAYVLLRNRAFDMNGNIYDVKIILSDITAADYSGKRETGSLFSIRADGSCKLNSTLSLSSTYDVKIEILNPVTAEQNPGKKVEDKTTVLYFADMDIPENAEAREFQGQIVDNNNTYGYYYYLNGEVFSGAEHIEVHPNDSSRLYVDNDNLMHAHVKDGWTQLVGTYYTGLQSQRAGNVNAAGSSVSLPEKKTSAAIVYDTGSIHLRFGGTHGSTALFLDDIFVNIVSNVRDSEDYNTILENGTGGYIDHGGEGPVGFARGASPVYSIEALPGYSVKDIWIDGTKITGENGLTEIPGLTFRQSGPYITEVQYSFENIQQNHTIDVSFKRNLRPVDLLLHKACRNESLPADRSVFKDAEFSIAYYPDYYSNYQSAMSGGEPERSWVFRTDGKGELRLSDPAGKVSGDDLFRDEQGRVCLTEGTYILWESKAPEGYALDSGKCVFTLKTDTSDAAVIELFDENGYTRKVFTYAAEEVINPDFPVYEELLTNNTITIVKTIRKEDWLEEHGKPGFAFRVSGRDYNGEEHTYFRMITFDSSLTGSGVETENVVLEDVPSGFYTVSELDTLRYVLTDIESDIFEVEKTPVGGEVEGIQEIQGSAYGKLTGGADVTVRFTDRKIRWDDFTDTSAVVNHIEIEHLPVQ